MRSLWGKPAYPKPALGPIPVLPPLAIAELQDQDSAHANQPRSPGGGANASKIDERDRDTLTKRLDEVDEALKGKKTQATQPGEESPATEDLEREVATLRTSLEALTDAQAPVMSTDQSDVAISAALRPLLAGLDDSDESVRFEAISALGDRLEPSLLPRIEGLLDDRDPFIRRYAVEYYGRLSK